MSQLVNRGVKGKVNIARVNTAGYRVSRRDAYFGPSSAVKSETRKGILRFHLSDPPSSPSPAPIRDSKVPERDATSSARRTIIFRQR